MDIKEIMDDEEDEMSKVSVSWKWLAIAMCTVTVWLIIRWETNIESQLSDVQSMKLKIGVMDEKLDRVVGIVNQVYWQNESTTSGRPKKRPDIDNGAP